MLLEIHLPIDSRRPSKVISPKWRRCSGNKCSDKVRMSTFRPSENIRTLLWLMILVLIRFSMILIGQAKRRKRFQHASKTSQSTFMGSTTTTKNKGYTCQTISHNLLMSALEANKILELPMQGNLSRKRRGATIYLRAFKKELMMEPLQTQGITMMVSISFRRVCINKTSETCSKYLWINIA